MQKAMHFTSGHLRPLLRIFFTLFWLAVLARGVFFDRGADIGRWLSVIGAGVFLLLIVGGVHGRRKRNPGHEL